MHNDGIHGVQLAQSSDSTKRVWFTTNLSPTYKHKSTSNYASDSELEKKVREKYEHDTLHAKSLMSHYESLGYTTEPITSECSIKRKKSVKGRDRTEIIESSIEKDSIKKK